MKNSNSIKRAQKIYDKRADSKKDAVQAAGQWGSNEWVPEICSVICDKIKLKKTDKVLEIGCGSGVLGSWIKERCSFYCGLDISKLMLDMFIEEYGKSQEINLLQSDTDHISFSDDLFDVVIINGVTMYFVEKELLENTIHEMERVSNANATIFIGENVIPSRTYWEYAWFQNLSEIQKSFAKMYIKFRIWIAKNIPSLAGKWSGYHREVSPKLIQEHFKGKGEVEISDAATTEIKRRKLGIKWKGNRRVDFVIKLRS